MEYQRFGNDLVVRLEKGEEITEQLLKLAEKEGVRLASVSGIGATDDFEVGVFNLETHSYDRYAFTGNHEITGLNGNLTTMDGKPYHHLHINCGNHAGEVVGGHLMRAKISLTAEIFLHCPDGGAERRFDPELAINLMHPGK